MIPWLGKEERDRIEAWAESRPTRVICARCGELVAEGELHETRDPWAEHRERCG